MPPPEWHHERRGCADLFADASGMAAAARYVVDAAHTQPSTRRARMGPLRHTPRRVRIPRRRSAKTRTRMLGDMGKQDAKRAPPWRGMGPELFTSRVGVLQLSSAQVRKRSSVPKWLQEEAREFVSQVSAVREVTHKQAWSQTAVASLPGGAIRPVVSMGPACFCSRLHKPPTIRRDDKARLCRTCIRRPAKRNGAEWH